MRGPRRIRYEVKNGVTQPVLLERHVLREIVDRLWLQAKIKVWQINQPVGGKVKQNVAGIPDLIGFIPKGTQRQVWNVPMQGHTFSNTMAGMSHSVPLFIEVKRPGGRRRPEQIAFIDEAKSGGCAAFFAESWMDVVRELSMFGLSLKID